MVAKVNCLKINTSTVSNESIIVRPNELEIANNTKLATNRGRTYSYLPISPVKLLKVAAIAFLALISPAESLEAFKSKRGMKKRYSVLQDYLCPGQAKLPFNKENYVYKKGEMSQVETIRCKDGKIFLLPYWDELDQTDEEIEELFKSERHEVENDEVNPQQMEPYEQRKHGEIFKDDSLVYEGELIGDIRDGFGKQYKNNQLVYEGQFKNDRRDGEGKAYKNGQLIYEGHFVDGKRHGYGKYYLDEILVYEGESENNEWQGQGKVFKDNELVYEGEIMNSERHGQGKIYSDSKLVFEGNFLYNEKHGEGVEHKDGQKIKSFWHNGIKMR